MRTKQRTSFAHDHLLHLARARVRRGLTSTPQKKIPAENDTHGAVVVPGAVEIIAGGAWLMSPNNST